MRWARPGDPREGASGAVVRSFLASERGAVTAEFAIVLPAVVLVLGIVIGAVMLAAHRTGLVSAAGEIARLEARGDSELAEQRLSSLGTGVDVKRSDDGALHCVTLSSAPASGALHAVGITGRGCAVTSGAES